MGDITRPKNTRCTIYSERDFRIRQFVGLMRSNILFGMQRQEAVGLVVEIARSFPGRYPLSRENVDTILDRRAKRPIAIGSARSFIRKQHRLVENFRHPALSPRKCAVFFRR